MNILFVHGAKEKPCRITPPDFKGWCFWTAQNTTRVGCTAALRMEKMLQGVSHYASAAAVRGGGKGPCQILVIRGGQSRCPQCEASDKSSLLFPPPTWSSLAAAQPASLDPRGSFGLPRTHGEKRETSGLERPRHEQSTARVGPVNTTSFEGWYGKMYIPVKMPGIQIRLISMGFYLSVGLCIVTNWPWQHGYLLQKASVGWLIKEACRASEHLPCVHMYHENMPQCFLLTRFICNCLWGNLGCLAMMFVLLNCKCWARTL